jgi:hypothetical protein
MAIENLADLVEPLKREVAPPGQFDTVFPDADDDMMFSYLADGFSEAQLDGYLGNIELDLVTGDVLPGLTLGEGALVTIYASMRILRTQILSLATKATYKAGPVEYSTENSSSVLKTALDALVARKDQLLKTNYSSEIWVGDAYWGRIFCGNDYYGAC